MKIKHSIHIICFTLVILILTMNIQVLASTVVGVTSITLNKTSEVLSVGDTDTLIASINPTDATNQNVVWQSLNTNIVNVVNGTIQAINAGVTIVTAVSSYDSSIKAYCTVTVNNSKTSISLDKTTDTISLGSSDTLTATVLPATTTSNNVIWSSSDTNVVKVASGANRSNGMIYGLNAGTAVVTATTSDGSYTASCIVKVDCPVISVVLNKTVDTLKIGATDTLKATLVPTQTTNTTVTWVSSDSSIVQVYEGVLMGLKEGSATITATAADGNKTATCLITVVASGSTVSTTSLTLNKTSDILKLGGTDTLTATVLPANATYRNVIWSSSNSNLVTVNDGILTGVGEGTAIITATSFDGCSSSVCSVSVTKTTPTTSITLNKTADTLKVGGTDTLTAAVLPITATNQNIIWTSLDPNIVTVSNGVLTGVKEGNSTITAVSSDGYSSAICSVTVTAATSTSINTIRLGGADRYETSSVISKQGWSGTSSYAVLATGLDYPDALSATPLAKKYNAPILLTDKDSIPQSVLTEIKRLNVTHVFIVGGTGVISQAVENQLKSLNITVERLAGVNRFETSIKIAEKLGNTSGKLMVAYGYEWSGALSASSIAAKEEIPIILTDKVAVPTYVYDFIGKNNFTKTYILGDTDVISNAVANSFPGEERIVGSNQYEKNINILNKFESDIDFSNICISTGKDFPDALTGSSLAASLSSATILVDGSSMQDVTTNYIKGKLAQIKNVYIFGGQGVLPDATVNTLFH